MAGFPERRCRAGVAALAACVCVLTAATAAAEQTDVSTARPRPPTPAQAERWAEEFIQSHQGKAAAEATGGSSADSGGFGGALFPGKRVVALYGTPGIEAQILGRKSVRGAKRKLREEAHRYEGRNRRPVVKGFDLVAVVATGCGGGNQCRFREPDGAIRPYLRAARDLHGRLILDIQPGRANFLSEVKALRPWLVNRNVDVGLDPEWKVGKGETPGQDPGHVSARQLNKVSRYLQNLIDNRGLPPKLMVVHQFRQDTISHRGRIRRPADVDVTLDFDGIGGPAAKRSGYESLSVPGLFDGFMLFYRLDSDLMSPRQVLHLDPKPDFVVYQ